MPSPIGARPRRADVKNGAPAIHKPGGVEFLEGGELGGVLLDGRDISGDAVALDLTKRGGHGQSLSASWLRERALACAWAAASSRRTMRPISAASTPAGG